MSEGSVKAGRGRAAAVPEGFYERPPSVVVPREGGSPVVRFVGEDGRERDFRFAELPLPVLHEDFAFALDARIGFGGGRRTQRAATGQWQTIRRFFTVLDALTEPPRRVADLRVRHVERFRMSRMETCEYKTALKHVQDLLLVLRALPHQERLDRNLVDFMGQRGHGVDAQQSGPPGYSDREFTAVMAAARSDVVTIRDRLAAGEALLTHYLTSPSSLDAPERERGAELAELARTGRPPVDYRGMAVGQYAAAGLEQARRLFVVDGDLAPLMIYAAGLSGRNPETLKELPAEHRVLEERAVVVTLTKRRRGKANSRTTVHWSTDRDPGRRLRTAGGFYLLLHEMMARSRALSKTAGLWSIWAGNGRGRISNAATAGHIGPFDAELGRKLHLGKWAARHGLLDDDGNPLNLRLTRLRTTVEVRSAKQVGGHLPSARLSNTAETSFTHYLRKDPFVREWSAGILTEAITDAHDQTLAVLAPSRREDGETARESAGAGRLDTLAALCLDIDHHPVHGGRCRDSFLTCLHCPNAMVLERHLPMLLALADMLRADLERRDAEQWVRRHGRTWQIITAGILPRFTAAQRANAARTQPATLPLDLLDGPQETP
ncbi:hypothetical protein PV721_28100 [Streptomyces sp. MB09-01]|uniref:hypothetical protein n=1 Tax=Streptomyces sp. MB09-01 TaxID=3028666 RepID=UPI0029BBF5DD|nr:hypothetical protein [Streptomyces sp. MB09-01]MDX3538140.1 hypothetical protein [Streptomyces sp. MB09-01]